MRLTALPIYLLVALPVVSFFAVGFLWVLANSFRSGVTVLNGWQIAREDHPVWFWITLLALSVMCAWFWIAVIVLILITAGLLPPSIVA